VLFARIVPVGKVRWRSALISRLARL
jgi:hypothetical protein